MEENIQQIKRRIMSHCLAVEQIKRNADIGNYPWGENIFSEDDMNDIKIRTDLPDNVIDILVLSQCYMRMNDIIKALLKKENDDNIQGT